MPVTLVTGASRGIGAAIALGLAERGHDLALNDISRQEEHLRQVADRAAAMGRRVEVVLGDVSDKAQVEAMAARILEVFGRIDAVVNNAGILIAGAVDGLREEHWDRVMDVNAKGSFLVIQSVLPAMKRQKYGRIVNIASIGGKHGAPEQAHYSASKAAVMGFSRVLAQEVGPLGITVNCVCPGIIYTDMGRVNLDDQQVRAAWQAKTAMARIGTPEDVVGPVAFFASDDSAFVTGQTLNVDGGIVFS
ncbi:3-oxoacyl-[acyl-carrier protein] reductase [Rubellimicrobium mesophilum DSM 19309]|uniref:3-oxoacyl-[acyl-carrier protein] reductase n=1 Tax=Rubellimicrobium mesophilum DSM 19309 TaxID=442562 RepID=A0A017HP52_9RHOB|nr:SDR family NAD(P)-dependent oxidoreductase [Rubellimicrobium mesophilum]EYD75529.1 3-oxoacyl-[acyl-carrier protein] reductase [Rubellimicrobium mesophilum DSM 19309]